MPVITHLGFDLSVVLLQKGNYSRLGKSLRKKVRVQFPSDQSSVSLSSTLVDLRSSIRTFISDYRSIHNAILIPSYASIDIIFSLYQLANEFNLVFMTSARASDAQDLMGYALCKKLPDDIPKNHPSLSYPPRLLFMIINHKHQSVGEQWQSIENSASIDLLNQSFISEISSALRCSTLPSLPDSILSLIIDFASTPASIIMAARTQRALRTGPLTDFNQLILSFVCGFSTNPKNSLKQVSRDSWLWLLLYTIRIEPIPPEVAASIELAAGHLNTATFRQNRTWKFQLFGRPDHLYFWGTHMRPLIANELPPALKLISASLSSPFPVILHLPECLIVRYEKPNHNLRYHQDTEGREYYNMAEFLILTFAGSPRKLKIKPFFSMYPNRELVFTIKCTNNIAVQISPLANELFLHSKAKSGCTEPSTTFAWRRGVPIKEAKLLYPHLKV